jgi:hypothetical protein
MTGEGRAMSGIQTEVLAANVKYSSDFGAKWVLWLFSSDHGYFSSLSELLPLISCTVQLGFLYRIGIK